LRFSPAHVGFGGRKRKVGRPLPVTNKWEQEGKTASSNRLAKRGEEGLPPRCLPIGKKGFHSVIGKL